MSRVLFNRITEDFWEKHEEATVNYANPKASVDDYYDENIAHRDQTNKVVAAFMSSLEKSSTSISDLYKGLNVITQLLKDINTAVKDDPAINKKIDKAIEIFAKISTTTVETALKSEVFSLKKDTSEIKSIMTEIYQAFKGQSFSAPSSSVTPTLALTHIPANVEGENATNTATEEPPSHTKGTQIAPRSDKGKGIATELDTDFLKKLVPASTTVRPDPDALIPYTINGVVYHLTAEQLQEQMDKEELIIKAREEARLISKLEVIKVVQEEAEKIGLDTKKIASAKADEKFKKA
ncbi:hypothetical protein Tco_0720700 [Tanacetum coccineum]